MPSKMQEPYLKQTCPHCNFGYYVETSDTGDWWLECNECGALHFCYSPMPHQYQFHLDPHKFKSFFGGYGSAKTSTCAAEMIKLTLDTPGGTSLIGANTTPQLEQTAKKDFISMMHPKLVANVSVQKNYMDLVNGHRILFRPLDDEGKARSLNLCFIWIEEASEVNFDYIVQLQTRMRNHATNHHQMLLSSNPDLGHVRSEFLMKADAIYGADRDYYIPENDKNPNISVHIASTRLNKYLPADYYASTARGKPRWWVERYLNASFDYAEGAVYQDFADHVVEPFEIPVHWERLGGADFGIQDPTVLVMGAIDPDNGMVYIYDEYFNNTLAVPQHAQNMKELLLDPLPYGALRGLVADPSGKKRGHTDGRSVFDHYAEYGIYFRDGDNRIDAGIGKVNAYFSLGRLKIFSSCVNTVREGMNYKYKPRDLDQTKNLDNKPIDKDNHTMDSLRYLVQELPDDPNNLKSRYFTRAGKKDSQSTLPFALQSEPKRIGSKGSSWYTSYH